VWEGTAEPSSFTVSGIKRGEDPSFRHRGAAILRGGSERCARAPDLNEISWLETIVVISALDIAADRARLKERMAEDQHWSPSRH
jgi:hypothetical protein